MIKIIKEGKIPKPKKYIYKEKCSVCGCEFEFEIEDCIAIERRINGFMTVDCPCCKNHIPTKGVNHREVEENE